MESSRPADFLAGSGYEPYPGFVDELFTARGAHRPHARRLLESLVRLGPERLAAADERREAIFMRQGITFHTAGSGGDGASERPFPLDLIPRIIPDDEWTMIKAGLAQRVRALNAFIDDVYHERRIVTAGHVPWRLIVTRPGFERAAHGIRPPGGVYAHVCGIDLVRDGDGRWKVLEDNVRTPSGISYVLENRAVMTRVMPELFREYRVRSVEHYPRLLVEALRAVAAGGVDDPTIVVWTPGPLNSAYFEHAFLARQMGVELVEASDLIVRDDVLYMRTTRGLERVHAVYRRLDDAFIDPMEFRADSVLGVPGLVRVYRSGNVVLANGIGTGVADDKAIYPHIPAMIRFYLEEEPILDNVRTFVLEDPADRSEALERLAELVTKPTGESGGKGVLVGPTAERSELEERRREIVADPSRWIAQETVSLSTAPTLAADGRLEPRHVDLRPFAVFGEEVRIVPGGLTRVALRRGSMVVNSSQGGGSKDTWVLEPEPGAATRGHPHMPTPSLPTLREARWRGQEQQQQQAGET